VKEFMVHVERAVRPVRAEPARKLKMRRELLAHLTSIYEEEVTRRSNPTAARAEALRRFGDPAALTRELQDSVPALERILHTPIPALSGMTAIQRLLGRRPGESDSHYAVRSAVWQGVLLTSLAVPLVVVRMAGSGWALTPSELAVMAGCLAALAIVNSAFVYLVAGMVRAVCGEPRPAALVRVAGYWAGAVAAGLASAPVSARMMLGNEDSHYRLPVLAVVLAVVLLGIAAVIRLDAMRKRRQSEWVNELSGSSRVHESTKQPAQPFPGRERHSGKRHRGNPQFDTSVQPLVRGRREQGNAPKAGRPATSTVLNATVRSVPFRFTSTRCMLLYCERSRLTNSETRRPVLSSSTEKALHHVSQAVYFSLVATLKDLLSTADERSYAHPVRCRARRSPRRGATLAVCLR
jgi:hypothetical protein